MADEMKPKPAVANPYLKKTATPNRKTIANSNGTGSNINNQNPKTPPRPNPYLKTPPPTTPDAQTPSTAAAATKAAITPSPTKLAQRAQIEENRKRALERRVASLINQEPNKKARLEKGHQACNRCGSIDSNTLCITWNHQGEIGRRSGWDKFRYSCCGRIAPSCCFVGRHDFSCSSGRVSTKSRNFVVQCNCHNGPAKLLCTRKESINCGRYFLRCSGECMDGCDFFLWADEAFDLPCRRYMPARDGVKEWIHIYANPFDQELGWMESTASLMPLSLPILRERLLAALVMHQCCGRVVNEGSSDSLEEVVEMVRKVFKTGDLAERKTLLLKELYPLNQEQITGRFGVTFQENDPLFDQLPSLAECRDAFSKATRENKVLRSCGVGLEGLPCDEDSPTFIHLDGLENYFAA